MGKIAIWIFQVKKTLATCPWNHKPKSLQELLETYDLVYCKSMPSDEDVFEKIFKEGNVGSLSKYLNYSLSVGDVLRVFSKGRAHYFRVEPVGFKLLWVE